jgi:hypothetical protein
MHDSQIPESVKDFQARELYAKCNDQRREIKRTAEMVSIMRRQAATLPPKASGEGEVIANVTLAYRQLEDASMRLGKAMQALDGGVSVYDKGTTVGATSET